MDISLIVYSFLSYAKGTAYMLAYIIIYLKQKCFFFQFKAVGPHQPKALRLDKFDFRASDTSKDFKHVKSAQQFVETWNSKNDVSSNKRQHVEEAGSADEPEPAAKRIKINHAEDHECLDAQISEKFIGKCIIPRFGTVFVTTPIKIA